MFIVMRKEEIATWFESELDIIECGALAGLDMYADSAPEWTLDIGTIALDGSAPVAFAEALASRGWEMV